MTSEKIKASFSGVFQIPVWAFLSLLTVGVFNMGLMYNQFSNLKDNQGEIIREQVASRATLSLIANHGELTDQKIFGLDKRLTTLEDITIRNGYPTRK